MWLIVHQEQQQDGDLSLEALCLLSNDVQLVVWGFYFSLP